MKLKDLLKITNNLISSFPLDAEVWLDDEQVMVVVNGERKLYDVEDVLEHFDNDAQIDWAGISKVKAWEKAGKKRIYFHCVGVPESAHARGKVFLELVGDKWVPNMRYQLMQKFADQLNQNNLYDPKMVEEKYKQFLQEVQ